MGSKASFRLPLLHWMPTSKLLDHRVLEATHLRRSNTRASRKPPLILSCPRRSTPCRGRRLGWFVMSGDPGHERAA
jgi:hypothetical protein